MSEVNRDDLARILMGDELDKKKKSNKNPAAKIVDLIAEHEIKIFVDQFNQPCLIIPNSNFVVEPLKSEKTEHLLSKLYWDEYKIPPNSRALADAINTLSGNALYGENQNKIEVQNRIGRHQDEIYFDIGDNKNIIKITQEGWDQETQSPVLFRRYDHQKTQVIPKKGGDLRKFLDYVNVQDKNSQILLLTYLVVIFVPNISRALLAVNGAKGAAKSTLLTFIRYLVDPSSTRLITYQPNQTEFTQFASHNYIVLLDNLTYLKPWLSDSLCRLVTGDAFSKRKLYTTDSDTLYAYKRAAGLCGINLVATQPDLLDRSLIITLDPIDESEKKPDREIIPNFEAEIPYLLGSIFDCLSYCLKRVPELKLSWFPRMADHFLYATAAAEFLGYESNELQLAFKTNKKNQNEEAINASSVAQVVVEFMKDKDSWLGTSSDLYKKLRELAEELKIERDFPKSTNWLWKKMQIVRTDLKTEDIEIEKGPRGSKANTILLKKAGVESPVGQQDIDFILPSSGSMEAVEEEIPF